MLKIPGFNLLRGWKRLPPAGLGKGMIIVKVRLGKFRLVLLAIKSNEILR